jgi:hypothetical protein
MKFSCGISVNEKLCPADLYEAIVQLKPDGRRGQNFGLTARPGDEEGARLVERIAAMCKARGLDNIRGAYVSGVAVHYEPADFQTAPLLWLMRQRRLFQHNNARNRDELGRVWLPATDAKPSIQIASIFARPWIVTSNSVRGMLESGGLLGLKFDEVAIKGHSIHVSSEPVWELRSSIVLPKMSNSVLNTTVEWEEARYRIDDPYGEPHYRQNGLQQLGTFDIAHTFERLSKGGPELIVSQRLYQHCLKNKIQLEVRPVRLDPD